MRIRNVKNKDKILSSSSYLLTDYKSYRGAFNKLFSNDNPIHIEIGMGKGNFIISNAKKYPNINFIGIEKFDNIVAKALPKIEDGLSNLFIIRMNAEEIDTVFEKEIDCIYLNFSDPWPKSRHVSRRLTSEKFLSRYESIFKDKKNIIMKTDNKDLFEFSLISFNNNGYYFDKLTFDLHSSDYSVNNIMTEYEEKFTSKGQNIYMVSVNK